MIRPYLFKKKKYPFLEYDFDSGSEASYTQVDATPTIRITPINHWSSQWTWWCVRSRSWAGKTPSFLIAKANHFNMVSGEWLAAWSTDIDTDTWYAFDNLTIGASDLSFSHNTPFPKGMIYVAALPVYPFSRTQRKITEWSSNSYVGETPSTTNKILGYTTARDAGDGTGRTAPVLPYYGFKIHSTRYANTKNKAILSARNHPHETMGSWALEGAVSWLLGGSVQAEFLLDWFDFYVYPCLNPQGVYEGYFRSNPAEPTQDHNRIWDASGHEDGDAFKTAWNTDAPSAEVTIDFHGWFDSWAVHGYTYNDAETLHAAFKAEMIALDAAYSTVSDTTASMLANAWRASYASKLSFTQEQGASSTRTPADWMTYGQNCMKALSTLLSKGYFTNNPGVGSRSFNGSTDRIDWAAVWNPAGVAYTLSAWVKASRNNANQYVLCIHDSGDTVYGIVLNTASTITVDNIRHGTSDMLVGGAGTLSTGVWLHFLATNPGTLVKTDTKCYLNGTEVTYDVGNTNGSAETAHTGSWSVGGRIYSDNRNLQGNIAQVAAWDRVLTADEIAALAAGQAPSLAAASGLKFYFKGNTSSLVASPGGAGTLDGTTQVTGIGNGPTIIYG